VDDTVSSQSNVMVIAFVALAMCLLWLAAHIAGLVVFLNRRKSGQPPPSKVALGAWIIGFAGGFTGPGVLLFNLAAFGMGIVELAAVRMGRSPSASRLPATIAVLTSSIILVMGTVVAVLAFTMT